MNPLVWKCQSCGHEEIVQHDGEYTEGMNEPCIYCDDGIAVIIKLSDIKSDPELIQLSSRLIKVTDGIGDLVRELVRLRLDLDGYIIADRKKREKEKWHLRLKDNFLKLVTFQ